jgi:hypothetical protein
MIEITNKNRFPVQLVIRSKKAPREFTTLNIPGIGDKKNVFHLEDERNTPELERAEEQGLVTTRHIPDRELIKGE